MNYRRTFTNLTGNITRMVIAIMLALAFSLTAMGQDRRFGIDDTTAKDKSKNNPAANTTDTSPRRYLPGEFNRRFGLQPGESQLETAPLPVIRERSLLQTAQQLAAGGQLERAVIGYQKAIAAKDHLALAQLGLGDALLRLGKFDEALDAFNAVITLSPDNAEAHLNLGVALAAVGKNDDAIEHYRRARELRKGRFPDADFNLALALFHQGDFNGAIEHYQQAIEQRKVYPAAYNNLGLVYQAMEDLPTAIVNFQSAIKQQRGNYPLASYNLARCYFYQGKFFPEAVSQLNIALKQQQNFPEAYLMLGNIYLLYETKAGAESLLKAKSYYQQAIALRADYPLAHENLAIACSKLGSKSDAFDQYRIAVKLYQQYPAFLIENMLLTINEKDSFFIQDELSRTEGPRGFKQKRSQAKDADEAINALLDEYQQLDDKLKAFADIHYCFGRVYLFVGKKQIAFDEFKLALELSNGNDKEAANLLHSLSQP